jgi:hypothetical protein
VLREAGLIAAQPVPGDNRVRLYTLEQDGLDGLAAWITELSQHWQRQLESFKDYVALRSARGPATQRDPAT